MRVISILACIALLAGCAGVQDEIAREGARRAVDQVMVDRFPNVDATRITPYTDCVINEASASEITQLASDALTGVDADTATLVIEIAARPNAASCLLQVGLGQAL
jgi:hypothetical protein